MPVTFPAVSQRSLVTEALHLDRSEEVTLLVLPFQKVISNSSLIREGSIPQMLLLGNMFMGGKMMRKI